MGKVYFHFPKMFNTRKLNQKAGISTVFVPISAFFLGWLLRLPFFLQKYFFKTQIFKKSPYNITVSLIRIIILNSDNSLYNLFGIASLQENYTNNSDEYSFCTFLCFFLGLILRLPIFLQKLFFKTSNFRKKVLIISP